jgi:hypothetical protein
MAILTTASSSPTRHTPPTSASLTRSTSQLIAVLHPALSHSLHFAALFQRLLSSTSFFLCVRLSLFTLYTARLLVLNSFYASKILLLKSYDASRLLAWSGLVASKCVARKAWKATEKVRRKLFFEFMVWILNPYAVALFIFWPGWIVIAGVWFGWSCLG